MLGQLVYFFVLLPLLLSWGGRSSRWRQRVIVIAMKDRNGRSVGIGRGGSLYFLDWYTELKGYWRFINHVDQDDVNVILSWFYLESLSSCAPHSTTLWTLACIGVFPRSPLGIWYSCRYWTLMTFTHPALSFTETEAAKPGKFWGKFN